MDPPNVLPSGLISELLLTSAYLTFRFLFLRARRLFFELSDPPMVSDVRDGSLTLSTCQTERKCKSSVYYNNDIS